MPEAPEPGTSASARARWFTWGLVALVLVGLVARVSFALVLAPDLPLPGDAQVYREMAGHLVDGDGVALGRPGDGVVEPSAEHPPLFPALLAALDLVGIGSVDGQRVGVALLASACVALVGLLGRRVAGPGAGLVAAAVAAVHPLWVQPPGMLMSESIHLVLVPAVLLVAMWVLDARGPGWVAALGALVGVGTLVRPEALGLLAVVGLPAVVLARRARDRRVTNLVLLVGVCLVIVAPWVVRNQQVIGSAALSTNAGKTILGSNCDDTYAGQELGGFSYDCFFGAAAYLVEVGTPDGGHWTGPGLDDAMGRVGREYMSDHRGDLPRVVAARVARMWGVAFAQDQLRFDVYEGRHRGLQRLGQWFHLVLLPFAAAGAWLLLRRADRAPAVLLLGPVLLVTSTTVLVYGGSRMRTGAESSVAVLAAVGVVAAVAGLRRRWRIPEPGGADGSVPDT